MTVLTLAGKLIDWHNPPKPTDRVIWSERTTGGKQVTGSLRTIAHLDRIVVLDKGQIIEDGTHAQLLERRGLYFRLWQRQSDGLLSETDDQVQDNLVTQES